MAHMRRASQPMLKSIQEWFRSRFKPSGHPTPRVQRDALCGAQALQEKDRFFGRERELHRLYTIATSSDVRFGVLYGESGCGKTSLLRAGLIPALCEAGFVPVYVRKPSSNPLKDIRDGLTEALTKDREASLSIPLQRLLRQNLREHFSVDELRELCFELGRDYDYDSLPGDGRDRKVIELLGRLERHRRIPELVKLCSDLRPNVTWEYKWAEHLSDLGGESDQTDDTVEKSLRLAASKGEKVILIFDQFEEYFSSTGASHSRTDFIEWLDRTVGDDTAPVKVLVSIQAQSFYLLSDLEHTSKLVSVRTQYKLQNFKPDQAVQVLSACAAADNVQFQIALIQQVVEDLTAGGFVRPVELQIVGQQLVEQGIVTKNQYLSKDGKKGILNSFVIDAVERTRNKRLARMILRQMYAEEVTETKSPEDLSLNDIARNVGEPQQAAGTGLRQEIELILEQLASDYILIHTEEDKYNLIHDYLVPYVRRATEGVETPAERANRLLKRYVALYDEDPRVRVPFRYVREIQKYASGEVKGGGKAQQLIRKSLWAFYATIAGIAAAIVITSLAAVLYFQYREQPEGTWTQYTFKEVGDVTHIAVQPGNEHTLWALVEGGRYGRSLQRSLDGGDTWTPVVSATTKEPVTQMVVGLGDHNQPLVYIATLGAGIYVFDDNAGKIELRNSGLKSVWILDLVIDPEDHKTVYLGTGDKRGLYTSTDFGGSWRQIGGTMLSNESIASIAVVEDPRRVYVLTDEDRVWFGDGKTDKWELAVSRGCGCKSQIVSSP